MLSTADKVKSNITQLCELCSDMVSLLRKRGISLSVGPNDLLMAATALKLFDSDIVATTLIERTFPFWDQIRGREEEFLVKNVGVIFSELPEEYRADISRIFAYRQQGQSVIPEEAIKRFWDLLCGAIKCCLSYIHENRLPKYSGSTFTYTREFQPQVKVKQQLELWGTSLQR